MTRSIPASLQFRPRDSHTLQMQEAKLLLKELQHLKQESKDASMAPGVAMKSRFSSRWGAILLRLYKLYLCGFKTVPAKISALEEKLQNLSSEIDHLSKQPDESTGLAFIIFNFVQVCRQQALDNLLCILATKLGLYRCWSSCHISCRIPPICCTTRIGATGWHTF